MSETELPRKRPRLRALVLAAVVVVILAAAATWLSLWQKPKDLLGAASKGDLRQVQALVAKGAGVDQANQAGETVLHLAATGEVAEYLISKGARVERPNKFGGTALHIAALHGRRDVVEVLLRHGASVNARDMIGATPLDDATVGARDDRPGDQEAVIAVLRAHGGKTRDEIGTGG